jgi:hypothetical protein
MTRPDCLINNPNENSAFFLITHKLRRIDIPNPTIVLYEVPAPLNQVTNGMAIATLTINPIIKLPTAKYCLLIPCKMEVVMTKKEKNKDIKAYDFVISPPYTEFVTPNKTPNDSCGNTKKKTEQGRVTKNTTWNVFVICECKASLFFPMYAFVIEGTKVRANALANIMGMVTTFPTIETIEFTYSASACVKPCLIRVGLIEKMSMF